MTYKEIGQLLESIARFSNLNYGRLPSKVILPSAYLDTLFTRTGDIKDNQKYAFQTWCGYFEIYESKTLAKPKIIFTLS